MLVGSIPISENWVNWIAIIFFFARVHYALYNRRIM